MAVCCCSMAGTAACLHCQNNPATWTIGTAPDWSIMRRPRTNADRIRAMTDEELADTLGKVQNAQLRDIPWLIWLKQVAEEDNNG